MAVFLESSGPESYNVRRSGSLLVSASCGRAIEPSGLNFEVLVIFRRSGPMVNEIKGQVTAGKGAYAIVVSRFNEFITAKLLAGAIDCLGRHGAADEQICAVWVPGACEIVRAAKKLAETGKYVAVICLGAVIRGQTCHYDYVCQQVARGIGQINYDSPVPATFGVLTCDTLEQAVERAGSKMGNAGADAAMTAMEMANVMEQI
jgi:6,7-dimethyl-8-ribityllumazine synthase